MNLGRRFTQKTLLYQHSCDELLTVSLLSVYFVWNSFIYFHLNFTIKTWLPVPETSFCLLNTYDADEKLLNPALNSLKLKVSLFSYLSLLCDICRHTLWNILKCGHEF